MADINPNDLTAAVQRLHAVKVEMERTTQSLQNRVKRFGLLAVISAIFLGCYFYFGYTQISKVDADLAVTNIADKVRTSYLPQLPDELTSALQKQAPSVIEAGGAQLVALPRASKGMLVNFLSDQLDKKLKETDDDFYLTVKPQLADIAGKIKNSNPQASDQQKIELILDQAAEDYRRAALQQIEQLEKFYRPRADELVNYINTLSKGQSLDSKEQVHRDLVQTFLTLMSKIDQESTTASTQPVK